MTAEMHKKTFMAYRKEGIAHPSQAAYQQHFSRMWEEGMSANNNEELLEKIGQLWREFLRLTTLLKGIGFPRFSSILTRNVWNTLKVGIHSTRLFIFINVALESVIHCCFFPH